MLESRMMLTGTWKPLANLANGGVARFALLSDGSVIIPRGGSTDRLIPDATGSYVNGAWSAAAVLTLSGRDGTSTIVFPDGRLLVFGGASSGVPFNDGQIYDPVAATWTSIAPFPESTFGIGPMMLLADGRFLAGSISGPQTYVYNPATDSWSSGPTKLYADSSNHESWTKLPDGSILSYDVNSNPQAGRNGSIQPR